MSKLEFDVNNQFFYFLFSYILLQNPFERQDSHVLDQNKEQCAPVKTIYLWLKNKLQFFTKNLIYF